MTAHSPLRVLLVSDFYPPQPGGLEAHVRRLACELHARGNAVMVMTGGTGGSRPPDDGFPVVTVAPSLAKLPFLHESTSRVFLPPWPDPKFQRRLLEEIRNFEPDVVHAHGWAVFSAAPLCRRQHVAIVATAHDYGLMCPKRNLRRGDEICVDGRGVRCLTCPSVEQGTAKRIGLAGMLAVTGSRTYARVDRLLVVSTYVRRRYLEAGIPASAMEIVPNFLDPDIAGDAGIDPGEANDVLFVGPASPHKGREVLEEAFKEMGGTGFRIVLVGDDGTSNASTEPGVVRFGRLEGDRLWACFRDAAVVVVPSTWAEPCPTVALEAMAFHRPVVASAVGGLTDIVEDGRTGVLVPPGDPRALAGALKRLAADPSARASMGREGRRKLEATFSSETVIPRIEAAYRAAMGGRAP